MEFESASWERRSGEPGRGPDRMFFPLPFFLDAFSGGYGGKEIGEPYYDSVQSGTGVICKSLPPLLRQRDSKQETTHTHTVAVHLVGSSL